MNGHWNWLIGRKLSLGEVVDVFGESAIVRHGDDETWILLCELLHEDYKAQDRAAASMCEAMNTGEAGYMTPGVTAEVRRLREAIEGALAQLDEDDGLFVELQEALKTPNVEAQARRVIGKWASNEKAH